jgi:ADP-heptose:LPS heptosyltransferase
MKVLLIQFKRLGDIVLTTPLIDALIKHNINTSFLTNKMGKEILQNDSAIYKIYTIEDGFKTLLEIRKENFDVIIDFIHNFKSIICIAFSRAKKKVAFHRKHWWKNIFYNSTPYFIDRGYTVFDRLELIEAIGVDVKDAKPRLFISEKSKNKIDDKLKKLGIKKDDFLVTMDITHRRETARWCKEKFIKIADWLSDLGAHVIFISAPDEIKYVEDALSVSLKKHIFLKNTTISEVVALVKKANLHIGNDSAPKHIAVALNTPSFTIFGGRSDASGWHPPNNPKHIYITKGLPCQPCNKKTCKTLECLKTLSVNDVKEKLKPFLRKIWAH